MAYNGVCLSLVFDLLDLIQLYILVSIRELNTSSAKTKRFWSRNALRKNHDMRGAWFSTFNLTRPLLFEIEFFRS